MGLVLRFLVLLLFLFLLLILGVLGLELLLLLLLCLFFVFLFLREDDDFLLDNFNELLLDDLMIYCLMTLMN